MDESIEKMLDSLVTEEEKEALKQGNDPKRVITGEELRALVSGDYELRRMIAQNPKLTEEVRKQLLF